MQSISSILSILENGLKNMTDFNPKNQNILLKELVIINKSTLCCHFYPNSQNSQDIRNEIGSIMSFFYNFFTDDGFNGVDFNYYACRAYDHKDEVILHALSSKENTKKLTKGDTINWVKSTMFQVNTIDYRQQQAKRLCSDLENSLREIIKTVLSKQFGQEWWNLALNNKLGNSVKETYVNQIGENTSDGNILIQYTFILQLKKIILTHWTQFQTYFSSQIEFEKIMDEFNEIRREEAHNREITNNHIKCLNEFNEKLLTKIASENNFSNSLYLNENWNNKIRTILNLNYEPDNEPNINESFFTSENSNTKFQISTWLIFIENQIINIESIKPPIEKVEIQKELLLIINEFRNILMYFNSKSESINDSQKKVLIEAIRLKESEMQEVINRILTEYTSN